MASVSVKGSIIEDQISKKDTNFRTCIPPIARLLITLRFLATGNSFQSLHFEFRIGASTIGEIIPETCRAIWDALQPIYMPSEFTALDWERIASRFEELWNFPHCLGCIDGKHVRIQCPPNCGSLFYNYKGFHSVVLQAVADADGCFLFVDVGDYGRSSDGGVFRSSKFGEKFFENKLNLPMPHPLPKTQGPNMPFVFLGDEAYPLNTSLMRPFSRRNLLGADYKILNYRHSRARRIVECAFGMLKGEWRIFETGISVHPDKINVIVMAACVLHNFVRKTEGGNSDHNIMNESSPFPLDMPSSSGNIMFNRSSNAALKIRDEFRSYFVSVEGQVPWQNDFSNK